MVLAAGAGRRLRPDTDALPKALLPVDGEVTILDIILRNLAAVGLRDVVIVAGHAAGALRDRAAALERDHGVRLAFVYNRRAPRGTAGGRRPGIILAVDDVKGLAAEEMKVVVGADGLLTRITKAMDPARAHGEYIGAALIGPSAAAPLAAALEATWRRDPSLYYEDGFQELADRGGAIAVAPIGKVEWVEVDDHDDLRRAREIAARC